ncbi:aldo/keto reductase [Umezawaea endophytica]|uniref:Aldo/keto reductase n=1 Tax=Umezawaea endophytica TaxID=1654476 RepID=A0A9X2VIN6_9PSEU|nr:aldo/keto reductase [Umezawaea endophytica]MCS7475763.1 aldo/keto reductase [Umezawaea endophytica]
MPLDSYRTLGRSGLRVSPLALGAMNFDDGSWGSGNETSFAILDRFREAGGNFVDTANIYSDGKSEEALGAYFARDPGARDRLVLATKFDANTHPGDPNAGGNGRKNIRRQVEDSLRRLNTDYVDLYWQHMWDRHTPVEETMSTLDDLVRAGKIRYVGASNTPAWAVAEATTIARLRGWEPFIALQVEYSLLRRTAEGEQFGVARALGLGVTPWSPLASGVLSGKYTRANSDPDDSRRAAYAAPHLTESTFALLDVLQRIAKELDTGVAAVALAWVRSRSEVTSTLIGARTLAQWDANAASLDVHLSREDLAELDGLTAPRLDYPAEVVDGMGIGFQQGGTTINGLSSDTFQRA